MQVHAVHVWSPPAGPRTVTSPGVKVVLGVGHSVDLLNWAMPEPIMGSTKSLV